MRATMLYGAGDARVQDVPDPVIENPTDAIVRVLRAAVCGSDLHPYRSAPDGGQGEAVRVPQADGTLVKLPVAPDSALLPSLLTLTDVFCTGHHAAVTAQVRPGTSVVVVGDGAVGLCAVLAAKRLGAEQVRRLTCGRGADAVLEGRIQPGRVFDRNFTLDRTPDAYRAMADRRTLKALITL